MSDELTVRYADDALLVLEKPSGLLSVPGRGKDKQDCLSRRAQHRYTDALVVHRLDMATSGLMVMARGAGAQRTLNAAFAARKVHKRYLAIVDGEVSEPETDWGVIDLPIAPDWPRRPLRTIDQERGQASMTRWRVLAHNRSDGTSRLELEPITGRSHQLRVHLQALGHPILGDTLYAGPAIQAKATRLLLHASFVELQHPASGRSMRFVSPPAF